MPYTKDVFISYSSIDKDWAAEFERDLIAHGLSVWRDQSNLTAGTKWEENLMAGVRDSQHLIVLWSKNAAATDWVRRERSNFEAAITPGAGRAQLDRLMIFVTLDDENLAYPGLQLINEIKDAHAYPGGIANLGPRVRQAVINKIVTAINAVQRQDNSIPVLTAVLAATKTEIENLDSPTLDSLVNDLGIANRQALFDHYEPVDPQRPKRTDWRPFGSNDTIATILANQQLGINNRIITDPKFRVEYVGDDFWSDLETAGRYADAMRERLSLIVIDPVSLNVLPVYRRAVILKKCLANNETAVMVPMPFMLSQAFRRLRTLLKNEGAPFFDEYYKPPVKDTTLVAPAAALGIYIGDEEDTERLLLVAMGSYIRRHKPESIPTYVRT